MVASSASRLLLPLVLVSGVGACTPQYQASQAVENPEQAVATLRTFAERGDVAAKRMLGALLLSGVGMSKDTDKGRALLIEAANQGDGSAAAILGNAYRIGTTLPQDDAEALRWLRLATERGNAAGEFGLGSLYGAGRGVPANIPEAIRLFRLSADQRYRQSLTQLGIVYMVGQGVPKNYVAGYAWLDLAVTAGSPPDSARVIALRDLAARALSPSQLARAQDLARNWKPGIDIAAESADAATVAEGGAGAPPKEPELPAGTLTI